MAKSLLKLRLLKLLRLLLLLPKLLLLLLPKLLLLLLTPPLLLLTPLHRLLLLLKKRSNPSSFDIKKADASRLFCFPATLITRSFSRKTR